MTKTRGLRPSLPETLDPDFKILIQDCWNANPSLRPSCPVIMLRLEALVATKSFRERRTVLLENDTGAISLCRALNDLLWRHGPGEWDGAEAARLIFKDATVTAVDGTLSKILSSERGPTSVKSLAWLMFGGIEDGATISPERKSWAKQEITLPTRGE